MYLVYRRHAAVRSRLLPVQLSDMHHNAG